MNNAKRAKVCEFLLPYHHKEWWHLPWLLCSDCFGALVPAKRRLRKKRDIESWFRVRICCWWDLCWSGLNCCDSDFEGFACSLPDVVPLSDKSIEATSHMCLGGVGKVFLCHWTLDQRGVKDCLCPFSIAAAWGWQRPEEAPASSPFSGAGFLSPVLLPRQTWAFPVLPYLVWDSLWLHSECNKPAWHFSVAKPENYPCFLMELLLFISTEIPLSSVCTGRSGKARLPPLIKSQIWSRS